MLDETGRKILDLLRRDGRMSHEQIARSVNLSRPAVHERIRKLEAEGYVRGYTARLDHERVGRPMTAFVSVMVGGPQGHSAHTALTALAETEPAIEEIHRVTGNACAIIKVRVAGPRELEALIDRFTSVPGVVSTNTTIVLSTTFDRD